MLKKEPKSSFKRYVTFTLKGVFLFEAAAFAISYGVWYRLNTNRDFRLFMYKNCYPVLDGYYLLGEKVSDIKTRELDQKVWTQENKI